MSDTRATSALMDKLHGMTAAAMIKLIEDYEGGRVLDKDGNPEVMPASFLQAVSKFLKDNGIDRPDTPVQATDKLKGLLPQLDAPDLSEFGNVSRIR